MVIEIRKVCSLAYCVRSSGECEIRILQLCRILGLLTRYSLQDEICMIRYGY